MTTEGIHAIKIGDRNIVVKGIGKLFYQEGFPISLSISELKDRNIEVSLLHIIEEFWDNKWSWKTIEMKVRGEMEIDINKIMKVDMDYLHRFYDCLDQPKRSNGGYEESREMIFEYLFGVTSKNAIEDKNIRQDIANKTILSA